MRNITKVLSIFASFIQKDAYCYYHLQTLINLSNKYMSSPQSKYCQQRQTKLQRTTKRFSTIHTQNRFIDLEITQDLASLTQSQRQKLPRKFRTQQSSPKNGRESQSSSVRFPQLFSRQNSESKNRLHLRNINHIKSDVAKTTFFLDSIIRILKDGEQLPQVSSQRQRKKFYVEDQNQFLDTKHEKKLKKPKIIKNQITRMILPINEKQRKIQSQEQQRNINTGLINAISDKIGQSSLKYNKIHSLKLQSNEFLPEGKDQLNKLRTYKFNKKYE